MNTQKYFCVVICDSLSPASGSFPRSEGNPLKTQIYMILCMAWQVQMCTTGLFPSKWATLVWLSTNWLDSTSFPAGKKMREEKVPFDHPKSLCWGSENWEDQKTRKDGGCSEEKGFYKRFPNKAIHNCHLCIQILIRI